MDKKDIQAIIDRKIKSRDQEVERLKNEVNELKKQLAVLDEKIDSYERDLIETMPHEVKLARYEKTFHRIGWDKIQKVDDNLEIK